MSTEDFSTAPKTIHQPSGGSGESLPMTEVDDAPPVRRQWVAETPVFIQRNSRRSAPAVRLFCFLLVLVLGITAAAYRFYLSEIKPSLSLKGLSDSTAMSAEARAIEVPVPEGLRSELAKASSQIVELQQQIDSFRSLQAAQEQRVEAIQDRLSALPAGAAPLSTPESAGVTAPGAGEPTFGAAGSPAMTELRLLKERNRLTAYADEAISTGLRRPLDLIIEAMKDPARATLYHAGKAEYYRVVGHFHLMNRIDPGYQLPIARLFPDQGVRDEVDVTTEQLISLLANHEQDWEVRLRAAFLLGGRRTLEVGEALLAAMRNDPSLDVAKEAQLSFQQNMGRHFLLYDLPAIESWWETQTVLRPAAEESKP
jgi:TolA-binding protein